jgi:hypothetical protein
LEKIEKAKKKVAALLQICICAVLTPLSGQPALAHCTLLCGCSSSRSCCVMSELLQVKASSIAASSVLGGEVLVPTDFFFSFPPKGKGLHA